MIRVGVVGCGYWGPNLLRNFAEATGCAVVAACDRLPERLERVKRHYPSAALSTDPSSVLEGPGVDAVAIATPVATHFELALKALRAGKHVWLEKPLAATGDEAQRLEEEADRRGLALMVDHTFVYTGAVRRIRDLVAAGELGDLWYYDSIRVNLGLFQHDVNVVWDLACHDLAILDAVVRARPRELSATAVSHVPGRLEDIAYLTLRFDGALLAHLHVNWLAPVKIRRTLIGGSRKMIVYDELEPSEKVRVYDRGITVPDANDASDASWQLQIGYRTGDMWAPQLELTEALQTAVTHFLSCIDAGTPPETDGRAGLRVVRLLEAAERSIRRGGRPVELAGA
jgi:predicted dehydrogenase